MTSVEPANRAARSPSSVGGPMREQGAEAFADRAARELMAVDARDGLSNAEVGTRLFISPRTDEFQRANQLGAALLEESAAAQGR